MGAGKQSERIEEMVTRYFICGLGARDAVPVVFGERYSRVRVHWVDGSVWNVLCVPNFVTEHGGGVRPPAVEKIRHLRMSIVQGAEPVIALVNQTGVVLSGREGFPLSSYDLPAAA